MTVTMHDGALGSLLRVLTFEARGPGFKYQPREIQPTLYFGPPDVIPLPVDQRLSSVVDCWPLKPEVQGSNTKFLSLWIKDMWIEIRSTL